MNLWQDDVDQQDVVLPSGSENTPTAGGTHGGGEHAERDHRHEAYRQLVREIGASNTLGVEEGEEVQKHELDGGDEVVEGEGIITAALERMRLA